MAALYRVAFIIATLDASDAPGDVLVVRGEPGVWQQGGYGFASTPTLEPDVSLAAIAAIARRVADGSPHLSRSPTRRPANASRADLPDPAKQFDQAPSLTLSRVEKRALDLFAGWPFCSPAQLAGFMDGVSELRANRVLRSLRRRSLAHRVTDRYSLADERLNPEWIEQSAARAMPEPSGPRRTPPP